MSEPEKKKKTKTFADCTENFRQFVVVLPREGDKRRITLTVKRGSVLKFDEHIDSYMVDRTMIIDAEETYSDYHGWRLTAYFQNTARPAPTRWERLKAWLMYPVKPSNLPQARASEKK